VPAGARSFEFDWPATLTAVFYSPFGDGAFQNFAFVFLILLMRWSRICRFANQWAQRDMLFDLYWITNVALYAVVGAAMVLTQARDMMSCRHCSGPARVCACVCARVLLLYSSTFYARTRYGRASSPYGCCVRVIAGV
jgi:hypothetical protein